MISMKSTLKDVYKNPVGKDVVDMLLLNTGKSASILNNPLVGSLKLSQLDKLFAGKAPGLAQFVVNLLNTRDTSPPPSPQNIAHKWWKEAVVYQIYPRSFMDSNGDGIGDLAGIKERIPYLKELGVDLVWLSPIYDSPNDDNGYDIRDYKKIMKEFGTMASFTALVKALHENGIKLMMDLVVNHTSDEHQWFKQALQDPTLPEKDYYIWAKGKNGGPPNNWASFFSGPAWNYYEKTDEWALHTFSKKQMDLNWDNAEMRAKIYEMINWWIEKGVDGFRMDVINFISKENGLEDGNFAIGKAFGVQGIEQYFYGPNLHQYLGEMRKECMADPEFFTVGETPGLGINMCRSLTAEERAELDMVFTFDHLDNPGKSRFFEYEYDLRHLKPYFLKWQQEYGNNCWQSLFFENHDNPRMVSKVQSQPAYRMVVAKLIAVLQMTQKGTPFLYQGQELGMTNTTFNSPEDLRDVEALNRLAQLKEKYAALGAEGEDIAFNTVVFGTRDHARTPMQWDDTQNAGFTQGTPWIGVNPNYPVINAKNEQENPDSVFNFYRKIIALRHSHEALVYGEFSPVFVREKNTYCFFRIGGGEKFYIEINLTAEDQKRPGPLTAEHELVLGNYGGTAMFLRPYEANVYLI